MGLRYFYSQIFKCQPNHCKEIRENTFRIFKYFIKLLSVFCLHIYLTDNVPKSLLKFSDKNISKYVCM